MILMLIKEKTLLGMLPGKNTPIGNGFLVGFSIALGINILRYIRIAIKWKEAKQYILSKMGRGGDVDTSKNLEDSFGYYWKSVPLFSCLVFKLYVISSRKN